MPYIEVTCNRRGARLRSIYDQYRVGLAKSRSLQRSTCYVAEADGDGGSRASGYIVQYDPGLPGITVQYDT